ncbi:MAG TPA: hypothetical protein V6D20_09235 [Candidatus Obscuribacterales bacterium]
MIAASQQEAIAHSIGDYFYKMQDFRFICSFFQPLLFVNCLLPGLY